MQKRVYFWGAISWWGKSPGVAWCASDLKVCYRHTKNLCLVTLFEDDGTVYRIVETRAQGYDRNVSYVDHFAFPEETPPEVNQFVSTYDDVQRWHGRSRAVLAQREDLQPPTAMQDTAKTLEIYRENLYPTLQRLGLNAIVEDNASPHNNQTIRDSHREHGAQIVGYVATEAEKAEIVELIRQQTLHYRRDQDKRAQMTKQTRELQRLPAWPPNSPDLNLIEIVWSWMVKAIRDSDEGWPRDPQTLKVRVLQAWDDIPLTSFRELVRSYRLRLEAILSVGGNRHPQFAWCVVWSVGFCFGFRGIIIS